MSSFRCEKKGTHICTYRFSSLANASKENDLRNKKTQDQVLMNGIAVILNILEERECNKRHHETDDGDDETGVGDDR